MAKMSFTSCPAEIQLMILKSCQPDDFENLVLSCKAIHGVAQPLIKEHNQRRKYRSFKFSSPHCHKSGPEDIGSVRDLLAVIALEPQIAQHIVHLDLSHRDSIGPHPCAVERLEAAQGALRKLLGESSYLREIDSSSDYIDEWLTHLSVGNDGRSESVGYEAAFLLTLLPNLESLKLSSAWTPFIVDYVGRREESSCDSFSLRSRDLVELIIKRANDESLHGQALSKLHTLHATDGVDGQSGVDLISIVPFLALNSLRHASHEFGYGVIAYRNVNEQDDDGNQSHADDGEEAESDDKDTPMDVDNGKDTKSEEEDEPDDDDNDNSQDGSIRSTMDSEAQREERRKEWLDHYANDFISPRYPVLGPNIETLDFSDCVIGPEAITCILRNMHNLKTLNLRYNMFDEYGDHWDIDSTVMGIMHTVGSSLESLSIFCDQVNPDSNLLANDLHGFKVLKRLDLCTTLFANNHRWTGDVEAREEDCYNPAVPLVDTLPESLETFNLFVTCVDYQCLMDLFRRFKSWREEKLPNLKEVALQAGRLDCWSAEFPDYVRQEKIIKLLAEEYGFKAEFADEEPIYD